jgi:hypothetical protein
MYRLLPILCCFAAALCAQPGTSELSTPRFGSVRWTDGTVREVFGLPGNFVMGEARLRDADALATSNAAALVATHGRLVLFDGNFEPVAESALDGTAVLGVQDDSMSAVAWVPETKALIIWNGKTLQTIATAGVPEDKIRSVSRNGLNAVLRSDSLTITVSLVTGNLVDCRADSNSFTASLSKLTLLRSEDFSFEQMNDAWVHAWSGSRHWAVRVNGEPGMFELPAPRGAK